MSLAYTKLLNQALKMAKDEAMDLKYNYIGTEHILLAMLSQKNCLCAKVMEKQAITYERILELVKAVENLELLLPDEPELSGRARRLLAQAEEEAKHMEMDQVGTEHVLIAILKDPKSPAM